MTNSFDRLRASMSGDTPAPKSGGVVPDFFDALDSPEFRAGDIQQVRVTLLHEFAGHTFKVQEDSPDFLSLRESIKENGIKEPLLVRPHPTIPGEYEIIAGHRRYRAAKLTGLSTVPATIANMDDNAATRLMAESNIQRPGWLPSEKARTYKVHLEATQKSSGISQGQRTDLTSATWLQKLTTSEAAESVNRDIAAKKWGISGQMFSVYIKLNDLLPELLDMTDDGRIVVKAAYSLAFLPADQQQIVLAFLQSNNKRVTDDTGKEIRAAGEAGELNEDFLLRMFHMVKTSTNRHEQNISIRFTSDVLLNKRTVKKALDNPGVLEKIEAVIADYAKQNGLELN
ncbi:MAG: ParB/RepB/Spo0J family partition protein [Oscillibacter sp.]|nr:ParB/RepB/Spo0J family partition protein [Oscillibacter sp.]